MRKLRYLEAKSANSAELDRLQTCAADLHSQIAAAKFNETVGGMADETLLQRVLNTVDVNAEILSLIDRVIVYEVERVEIRFAFGDSISRVVEIVEECL